MFLDLIVFYVYERYILQRDIARFDNLAMKKFKFLVLFSILVLSTSACTPTHSVHGNYVKDHSFNEIKPGVDTKFDVLRKLSSPTTKSVFDDNVWFYLGQEFEKHGILDPKVVNERIVVVTFDEENLVSKIEDLDASRVDLNVSSRETPTSGNEMTVLQQFLSNLGKFNTEQLQ